MHQEYTPTDVARFWSKVDTSGECWLWTASCGGHGYGQCWMGQRVVLAHRVAYILTCGPIPPELSALHRCDVKRCVNPTHLWLGTAAENAADCRQKGRTARGERNGTHTHPERVARGSRNGIRIQPNRAPIGERNGQAKLTIAQVREIRRAYMAGEALQHQLATRFGVCQQTVCHIVRRTSWRHVL